MCSTVRASAVARSRAHGVLRCALRRVCRPARRPTGSSSSSTATATSTSSRCGSLVVWDWHRRGVHARGVPQRLSCLPCNILLHHPGQPSRLKACNITTTINCPGLRLFCACQHRGGVRTHALSAKEWRVALFTGGQAQAAAGQAGGHGGQRRLARQHRHARRHGRPKAGECKHAPSCMLVAPLRRHPSHHPALVQPTPVFPVLEATGSPPACVLRVLVRLCCSSCADGVVPPARGVCGQGAAQPGALRQERRRVRKVLAHRALLRYAAIGHPPSFPLQHAALPQQREAAWTGDGTRSEACQRETPRQRGSHGDVSPDACSARACMWWRRRWRGAVAQAARRWCGAATACW